jgi:hypothetical protein
MTGGKQMKKRDIAFFVGFAVGLLSFLFIHVIKSSFPDGFIEAIVGFAIGYAVTWLFLTLNKNFGTKTTPDKNQNTFTERIEEKIDNNNNIDIKKVVISVLIGLFSFIVIDYKNIFNPTTFLFVGGGLTLILRSLLPNMTFKRGLAVWFGGGFVSQALMVIYAVIFIGGMAAMSEAIIAIIVGIIFCYPLLKGFKTTDVEKKR